MLTTFCLYSNVDFILTIFFSLSYGILGKYSRQNCIEERQRWRVGGEEKREAKEHNIV